MQITINPLVFSFFFACPTVKNSRAWTSELVRGKRRSWLRHCLRGSERVLQGGQEQGSRPPPHPAPSNGPEGGGKAASRSHACQHARAQSCSPAVERGGNPPPHPAGTPQTFPRRVLGAGKRGSYSQIGNEVQGE